MKQILLVITLACIVLGITLHSSPAMAIGVTITSPAPTTYVSNGNIVFAGTISEPADYEINVVFNQENKDIFINTNGPVTTFSVPITLLNEGKNFVEILISTNGNPYPPPSSVTVYYDKTDPGLTVTALPDGTVTSNNLFDIEATATDANLAVSPLTLALNGVSQSPTVTAGHFNTAVTLLAGSNTIVVTARDKAGNQITDTRTIVYDHTAPTITLAAPTPAHGSVTNQQTATVKGNLDEAGTVDVTVGNGTPVHATMNGLEFTAQVSLAAGSNKINITASDAVGNGAKNSSTIQRTVTFDDSNPTVFITDPAQTITTTLGSYPVKGTAGDQYSTLTLDFKVDGTSVTPAPALVEGAFQQSVPLTTGKTYAISVTATDQAGNASTATRNIVYRPIVIADALRALQISLGLIQKVSPQDDILDVAPMVNNLPHSDGAIEVGDALVLLRKSVGLVRW